MFLFWNSNFGSTKMVVHVKAEASPWQFSCFRPTMKEPPENSWKYHTGSSKIHVYIEGLSQIFGWQQVGFIIFLFSFFVKGFPHEEASGFPQWSSETWQGLVASKSGQDDECSLYTSIGCWQCDLLAEQGLPCTSLCLEPSTTHLLMDVW